MVSWYGLLYSRNQVNQAGGVLIDLSSFSEDEVEYALAVINNWRSSHNFPLNTFQCTLRRKASQVHGRALVAQRIKRLSSISAKLRLHPAMKLSQMQDIGGCRAIVKSVSHVYKLVRLYKKGNLKHKLHEEYDYIRNPKESGYRSVHLVYRYYSDRSQTYNGHRIEMQFRSLLQHAWATAVEAVGTFTRQALKSSQGEENWLRFFALMGGAIAIREGTPLVPNIPERKKELKRELQHYARLLDVQNRLEGYAFALQIQEEMGVKDAHYFLVELDAGTRQVKITGYARNQLKKASEDYLAAERSLVAGPAWRDAVLVSVESVAALKRAYPNYFLDTKRFITAVGHAIHR
jgi:ppGpp synthetase/RelA/SpoT-type nucleotidyltranferase